MPKSRSSINKTKMPDNPPMQRRGFFSPNLDLYLKKIYCLWPLTRRFSMHPITTTSESSTLQQSLVDFLDECPSSTDTQLPCPTSQTPEGARPLTPLSEEMSRVTLMDPNDTASQRTNEVALDVLQSHRHVTDEALCHALRSSHTPSPTAIEDATVFSFGRCESHFPGEKDRAE